MKKEDLKIGAKITIKKDQIYRIIDLIDYDNKNYIFCSTTQKPIIPMVFEYKIIDDEIRVELEENNEILKGIFDKIISQN
jgi:hypothetical protein